MSTGDVVVDDHLLFRVLTGDEPGDLRRQGGRVFTTGLWYHRLCRAFADTTVVGVMSRSLGGLDERRAADVIGAITALPDTVGLVSLRALAEPMAQLIAFGVRLNLMSLEALAAARRLDAEICLAAADENPQLLEAARQRAVPIRLVGG